MPALVSPHSGHERRPTGAGEIACLSRHGDRPDTVLERDLAGLRIDEDWVEDYLEIVDAEPGKIWFENGVGPIAVPRKASDLARPGWSAFVTAVRIDKRWHLLEVGVVYP